MQTICHLFFAFYILNSVIYFLYSILCWVFLLLNIYLVNRNTRHTRRLAPQSLVNAARRRDQEEIARRGVGGKGNWFGGWKGLHTRSMSFGRHHRIGFKDEKEVNADMVNDMQYIRGVILKGNLVQKYVDYIRATRDL